MPCLLVLSDLTFNHESSPNLKLREELNFSEQKNLILTVNRPHAEPMRWNNQTSWTLLRLGLLALMVGFFAACTGGKQVSGDNPNKITQEQIESVGATSNAYVLVQRLHPNWLEKRGTSSINRVSDVVVYVEGSRRGGPDALRQINVMNVEYIEYLNSDRATLQYGSGHDHGAIRVELKEMN